MRVPFIIFDKFSILLSSSSPNNYGLQTDFGDGVLKLTQVMNSLLSSHLYMFNGIWVTIIRRPRLSSYTSIIAAVSSSGSRGNSGRRWWLLITFPFISFLVYENLAEIINTDHDQMFLLDLNPYLENKSV